MNTDATTVTVYQTVKDVMDTMIVGTTVMNGIAVQVKYYLY